MNCTTLQTESESVAVKDSVRENEQASEQQNQTQDGSECIRNTFEKEKKLNVVMWRCFWYVTFVHNSRATIVARSFVLFL